MRPCQPHDVSPGSGDALNRIVQTCLDNNVASEFCEGLGVKFPGPTRRYDRAGDFVLHCKYILELAVKALRPNVMPRCSFAVMRTRLPALRTLPSTT